MISDIKDMSLDYIDGGLTLFIFIHAYIPEERGNACKRYNAVCFGGTIYSIVFDHLIDDIKEGSCDDYSKIIYIKYSVLLGKDNIFQAERVYDFEKSYELLDRVKRAYPNERIITT